MSEFRFILDGAMAIVHFGKVIAVIDYRGRILWRDITYPLYLVEYLLMQPDRSKDKWN